MGVKTLPVFLGIIKNEIMFQHQKLIQYSLWNENMNDQNQIMLT